MYIYTDLISKAIGDDLRVHYNICAFQRIKSSKLQSDVGVGMNDFALTSTRYVCVKYTFKSFILEIHTGHGMLLDLENKLLFFSVECMYKEGAIINKT